MKKNLFNRSVMCPARFLLIIFLVMSLFRFQNSSAQIRTLHDFDGPTGQSPHGDLIPVGSYLYGMTHDGGANNLGTIFKILPDGSGFTNIHHFSNSDGHNPSGSLFYDGTYLYGILLGGGCGVGTIFKIKPDGTGFSVVAPIITTQCPYIGGGSFDPSGVTGTLISDGTYLYGMTQSDTLSGGGVYGGTIFKVDTSGTPPAATIHFFNNDVNGRLPSSSLVFMGSYLYGMTTNGGTNGMGTLFKTDTAGTFTKLLDFRDTLKGSNPLGSLISDGTALYGMTQSGGINGFGVVFKILPNGTYTKLLDLGNVTAGITASNPYGSLIYDGTFLYGMTSGSSGGGVLFRIKPDGKDYFPFFSFNGINGAGPTGSLYSDGTYFYGMTSSGGVSSLGNIFKFCPPAINTTASGNLSICSGSSTTLTATGKGTLGWYSAATGGTYLGSGTSYTTPVLTSSATYYVQDSISSTGMVSIAREIITVKVNPLPNVVANATSNPVCQGSSTIFTGGGASTYTWTGGVTNGTSFTPLSTQTYTVTGTDTNACRNTNTITVTVNALPNVTANASGNPVCSGSSTTLNGGGANTYTWTGGVTDGVAFTPASTQTYTVTGTDINGCVNTNTIIVTVNALPNVTANATSNPICPGGTTTLTGVGASTYTWSSGVSDGVAFSPPSTQTYTVTGTDVNGCVNTNTITVTVNATPTVNVSGTMTITTGNSTTLTATGASTYSWTPGTGLNATTGATVVANPTVTTNYTVTGTSSGCTNTKAFTITVGYTKLQAVYCGITETAFNQSLYCVAVNNATNYRYEITDLSNNSVVIYPRGNYLTNLQLDWLSTTTYARTYSIRVAAFVSGNWSSYGTSCTVTTPAAPATQLAAGSCGITESTLNQSLYCNAIAGAANYRYEITDLSNNNVVIYPRGNYLTNFQMDWLSSTAYARTYRIRIATNVGGVWFNYGPACTVTTPGLPTTQLQASSCGITEAAFNQTLNCVAMSGATNYRYEITDLSNNSVVTYIRGNYLTNLQLDWLSTTTYARTYSIRVAAYHNGAWGSYGSACTVTTPAAPVTQLQPSSCNITEATTSQVLYCNAVTGANNYKYELTNQSNGNVTTYFRGNYLTNFQMSWVPGIIFSKTYSVRVAAAVGGVWFAYGPACNVTTAASFMYNGGESTLLASNNEEEKKITQEGGLSLNMYPNPNDGHVYLQVSTDAKLTVTDLLGQNIYEGNVTQGSNELYFLNIKPGMYIIRVTDGVNATQVRMIKE
ncbi:MAG TPA: choice-of-anchor tandem repeat GloVer-containing protein [Bacteroidia bacterium]|nr:choice-of-anchor tandem repeat GloVer-containing protein [Bacteroidia bacterium]